MRENLIEALKRADAEGTNLQVDQIAFLIGMFPGDNLRDLCKDCPRIAALLPEMERTSQIQALMAVADYMDREDHVGYVADRVRKFVRP